jgi:hypothetical protein
MEKDPDAHPPSKGSAFHTVPRTASPVSEERGILPRFGEFRNHGKH